MNPLTNTRNITKLNEREIKLGVSDKASWHNQYKGSAWIFVGGLNYELSEGDIISVFSQYGEIVNLNLIRDKKTGRSKGYCFICYEDQRSTVLAVDNFNGIKILGRIIRVDHVANYRMPKDSDDLDNTTKNLRKIGCGPDAVEALKKIEKERKSLVKSKDNKTEKVPAESGRSKRSEAPRVKQEVNDPGYNKYETTKTAENDPRKHSKPEARRKKSAERDDQRERGGHKHSKSKPETSKRSDNDHIHTSKRNENDPNSRSHKKSKPSSKDY